MNVIFMTSRVAVQIPDELTDLDDILDLIEDGLAPVESYAHSSLEPLETIHGWKLGKVITVDDTEDVHSLLEDWDEDENYKEKEET